MKNTFLIIQNDLKEISDELNSTDWSALPVGEEYGVWIPIAIIFAVFFGFRFMAKVIENE
ncbi:hypothetical protein N9C47_05145 [Flavobacteriaceae bacterium]|jgi:hypothetical protein|nr:hypothetical protein [Flavobacteriaceae bacterium]